MRDVLLLSGGNSLGAFEAGAISALHRAGIRPEWIVGTSIGAVNGAIIAGNPVNRRLDALRRFWSQAARPTPPWLGFMGQWGRTMQRMVGQFEALGFGNPAIFRPSGSCAAVGLYDLSPLRRTLTEVVDFDRLNGGELRVTVTAVDIHNGEEIAFDTERDRIEPDHILASAAFVPEFVPVQIDGRLLGDGGLAANLPFNVVRQEAMEPTRCFAVDVVDACGHHMTNIAEAAMRRQELMFASQSRALLAAYEREVALRDMLRSALDLMPGSLRDHPTLQRAAAEAGRSEVTLVRILWQPGEEPGVRTFDYSDQAVMTRWEAGERAVDAVMARQEELAS